LVRTRGIEVVGQSDDWLLRGLKLTSSLTYARSIIVSDSQNNSYVGTVKPRIPAWRASLLAAYSPDEHWVYSLAARYSSRMVSSLGGAYDQTAYGGVSQFFIIDTKVRYKFDKNWSASVGVNDLNNCKSYVVHPNSTRTYMADLRYDYK
jgi:iron complex outermembrane receptor protein